jgi:hypothetical protein
VAATAGAICLGRICHRRDRRVKPHRIAQTLGNLLQRMRQTMSRVGPHQRHVLAGELQEGRLVGRNGALQGAGAALAAAEGLKRVAQIALDGGPVQGRVLARPLQERCLVGLDCAADDYAATFALANG